MAGLSFQASNVDEETALEKYQKFSAVRNAQIDEEALRGNDNTLDITFRSHIPVLTFRYIRTAIPKALSKPKFITCGTPSSKQLEIGRTTWEEPVVARGS
jgi:hypothetical protein